MTPTGPTENSGPGDAPEPDVEDEQAVVPDRVANDNGEEDFSEFLWMENEEAFDEQVLKELEDEEILNFYYNLTEAEQEAEAEAALLQQNSAGAAQGNGDTLMQHITAGMHQIGLSSRLNPNAREFVPSFQQQAANSVPVSESKQ